MSRCKSPKCGAATWWLVTASNQKRILNPGVVYVQPHIPDTPKTTVMTRDGVIAVGTRINNKADIDVLLKQGTTITMGWIPHWITCKDPDFFRKKKRN